MKRNYAFLDTAIAVASDESSILDWLDEFLTPAFRILPLGAPAQFRVTIRSDRRAAEEIAATRPPGLLATKPCFALDQETVAYPHWMVSGRIAIDDRRFGAFYVLRENEVEVVIQPGARRPRSGAMRVIREIASARALTDANHLLLHAAALERDGRGVLIAGAKGSGKTTVLGYLTSRAGCGMLTNDRALLRFDGATVEVFGMPTIVSVRRGTIELLALPSLRALLRMESPAHRTLAELDGQIRDGDREPGEPLRLSPAQLARALGVSLSPRAVLSAIAFPEPSTDDRALVTARLSPDEAAGRLREARFGLAAGNSVPTAFDELVGRRNRNDGEAARLGELAARVPCFRLSIGASLYRRPEAATEIVCRLAGERCS